MKNVLRIMIPLIFAFYITASSTIINVPADYPTIQQGIDAVYDCDTVLVHAGIYVENINFNGQNIILGSLFLTTGDTSYITSTVINGNYQGSVITLENGEESTTVISGFTIQNGLGGYSGSGSYGGGITCLNYSCPVISNNKISANYGPYKGGGIYCFYSSPIICDNTISGNFANDYGGAGIYCCYSSPVIKGNKILENRAFEYLAGGHGGGIYSYFSSPTITNNTISENVATGQGGGIHCWQGSPIIGNNFISENYAERGGGIKLAHADAIIDNNVIDNNEAYFGGGIRLYESAPTIISNRICRNTSVYYGGGIASESSSPTIINNIIWGNSANGTHGSGGSGGGVFCGWSDTTDIRNNIVYRNSAYNGGGLHCRDSSPNISNNTITENIANYYGGGFACDAGSVPEIVNNVFWGDSAAIGGNEIFVYSGVPSLSYCDIEGGWQGIGNIDIDPLFRDPPNGDFHLMYAACGDPYDSPCIDTGDPTIQDILLDCDWGLGLQLSDMGAYGGGDSTMVAIDDFELQLPEKLVLLQNYPNPFNAQTTISYVISEPSDISITIYNILGQQIKRFVTERKQAGTHTIRWSAGDQPSGIYIARLEAGDISKNVKMILLK